MNTLADRIGGKRRVIGGPFGSNLTQKDYVSEGVPVIRGTNMEHHGRWIGGGFAFVNEEKAKALGSNIAHPGDIVVTQRGTLGQVSIIPTTLAYPRYVISQSQMAIAVDGSVAHPQYVYYYLRSPAFNAYVANSTIQTGVPHINLGILRDAPALWPTLPEQCAIATTLGSLDDKIELNQHMNETLEAMAQAIFRDWFVDFGPTRRKLEGAADPLTIMGGLVQDTERAQAVADLFPAALGDDGLPEGWKRKALLEEARLISGGTPKTDRQDYWDGGIPWASAKDVSQCGETLLLDTERKITQSGLANSSTKMVPKFSTAVVARGATTGRHCMLAEDMAMNQTCYALHSASGRPFLLYNMFGALIGELVQAAHGSVFDTITTKTLATGFVTDAEGVAAEFEKTAAPLYAAIDNNSRQSRTLAATRDLLLPKLMSGEIRISEADDLMEAAQ